TEDDNLFCSAGNEQEAVAVDITQIAGAEPAIRRERLGIRGGVVDIARRNGRSSEFDFANPLGIRQGNSDLSAGERPTGASGATAIQAVAGKDRGRLGEPVA